MSAASGPSARPTMRDVAALAGVSLKTVSRVVNGIATVDPILATKVRNAADKLGYRPNMTASNLRRGDRRTGAIGLLLQDAANPFSAALMRAVENVARTHQTVVLVGSLDDDPARERELSSTLFDRRVDGLVIMPSSDDHAYLMAEHNAGTGLVFVDRSPKHLNADSVTVDNVAGAAAAVEHLMEHGHRRIAFLGDVLAIMTAVERFDGYRRAFERRGVAVDSRLVAHGLRSIEAATSATSALLALPEPPTALFTSQNLITIGACRALRALGRQRSVAMVGFDDFPLADMLDPGVTVVAQDAERIGRLAAEILFSRLDGDRSPARNVVVDTSLIPRGSGEIAAPL
jgi:LacI family transcriptional regulator